MGLELRKEIPRASGSENQQQLHLSAKEGTWKLRQHLKQLAHRLVCIHVLTLGSGRGEATQEVPDIYRKRLSCVASGQELEAQPVIPVWSPPDV